MRVGLVFYGTQSYPEDSSTAFVTICVACKVIHNTDTI